MGNAVPNCKLFLLHDMHCINWRALFQMHDLCRNGPFRTLFCGPIASVGYGKKSLPEQRIWSGALIKITQV